ncbi:MAG: type II toxin-antitoxin system YafQ family toxin [Candidatus Aminicenantes bacterium]|nr:type II toxin-antitoxin system YafQ family toxin [Candidatus Aminicenantes bacterium]
MKIFYTSQFKKDYKKLKKQNKDLSKLKIVLDKLVSGQGLKQKHLDHPLQGEWKGHRDCHIEPDWILIYRMTSDELILERRSFSAFSRFPRFA